jgi:sugar lactone lactonase YvrE
LLLGAAGQLRASSAATVTTTRSPVNFAPVALGASSGNSQSLSFTIPSGITVGGISAVTQGAPNLDFTVTGGTCANGTTNANCTVQVQFLPTAPGPRFGAVVLTDPGGNLLITVPLDGTGTGPMVAFDPGMITTDAGIGYCTANSGDHGPATSACLYSVSDVALDGAANLYISDGGGNVVRKVNAQGTITTFAGIFETGFGSYGGDNGPATSAYLNNPSALAADGAGNVYIADSWNHVVRKVATDGIITTVAGNGNFGYSGDNGPATSAELTFPFGIALDGAGNLYISDFSNQVIRMVTPGGVITTIAGNNTAGAGHSGDGGPALQAQLNLPYGIAVDGTGNLYIADMSNNVIRKVTQAGTISTVAGNQAAGEGYSGDGGPATSAQLDQPRAVAVDAAGNLYIADTYNNVIRMVTPAGVITTVAGNYQVNSSGVAVGGFSGDNGAATSAQLNLPNSIALDGSGNLFIADMSNERVRKVVVSSALPLTFPNIYLDYASAPQDVKVLNLGNTALAISKVSTPANFSLAAPDTSCKPGGQSLGAAGSCVLGIEFTPAAAESISGSIVITDNTLNVSSSQQAIALQGTGMVGTPAAQTITFPNPGSQRYGTQTTVSATASSGLPVSFALVSGPATLSGNTLSFTGVGTVAVRATQAGNNYYASATPVTVSITVNPAPLTVTANSASAPYGAYLPKLTGTLWGVVAGDGITASYSTTAVRGSPAGQYPIVPALNDPNSKLSDYQVTVTNGTLTIMPAVVALVSSLDLGQVALGAAGGSTQSVTFTVPSGITLGAISAVTEGASKLDFSAVGGTCAIGTTNTNCTVQVRFLPTTVGLRMGAVVLSDKSGNLLIAVPVHGIGTAPMVAFGPGIIATIAGNGQPGDSGDNGPAISAEFYPSDIALDGGGNLYIVAGSNQRVRKVSPGGTITALAGTGQQGYGGDGGPATSAQLSYPCCIAVDGAGNLYIADTDNDVVRRITPGGVITTVAGQYQTVNNIDIVTGYSGDGGPATSAQLNGPNGIAVDGAGNFYISDWGNNVIRKVAGDGTITTVVGNGYGAGLGYGGYSGDGGPATSAQLNGPGGIVLDGAGNLYIADTGNKVIRKVAPDGIISTIAGDGSPWGGYWGDGGPAVKAGIGGTGMLRVDGAGNLYIADYYNDVIRKVTPGGIITTIAGNYQQPNFLAGPVGGYSGDGGPATSAQLNGPLGVALDGAGNFYIADSANYVIRKVDVSDSPSLNFAGMPVGSTSVAQDVTVLNLGNTSLDITQISTAPDFSLGGPDTTCGAGGQSLAAAACCVLGIEFSPSASGSSSSSVILTDNTLNAANPYATQSIALAGTGTTDSPAITLSPTALSFPVQVATTSSSAQTVTLTNFGQAALSIASIATSYGFTETTTCGSSLAAGANCTIAVTFAPSGYGTLAGSLTVTSNASNGSVQTVSLSGMGITYPRGNISLVLSTSPSPLAAGSFMTLKATVETTAMGTLSGPITFATSTGTLGEALVGNGSPATIANVAVTAANGLGLGVDAITASYPGNPYFLPANGSLSVVVYEPGLPVLQSLSSDSATTGDAGLALTVTGTHFNPASMVLWQGAVRATTYISSTQLTAAISASDIAEAGTNQVNVVNLTALLGTSSALPFAVVTATPVAAISTGSIAGLADGNGNHLLALAGTGFVSGSTVQWNGVSLTTTYLSPWQLSAVVTASEYAALPATVTVTNPSGTSVGFLLQ